MSALQEAIFERLYGKYQRTFGEPPPFQVATVDEAVAYMRSRLRAHASETAHTLGAGNVNEMTQQHHAAVTQTAA